MRYAFITDIHGRRDNVEKVLDNIHTFSGIDEIICLGDVFEVKIPRKELKDYVFQDIEEIIDFDPKLLKLLKGIRLIKGNQEERILDLIPKEQIPEELHPFLLNLPLNINLSNVLRLTHGHNFNWVNEEDYWRPIIDNWDIPWIFYGHNHQNLFFQVKNGNKGTYYERQNIINGEPKELDTKSNFLINVGDMKYDNPSWLLLDTQEEHIIFNILG